MYTEQDLVRIAKRENNNKRKYLVVNRLQGKHIPVKPHEALAMFRALAETIKGKYEQDRLLLVGFAETATAIGAAVAAEVGADYMQTTRESVPDVEYLYFSEEHSHATEQKLVKNDIDRAVRTIDRIIFVEDEVTTGKTILNIIRILKKQYSEKIKFSVASVLNGMEQAALDTYEQQGIELFWLVKTSHATYTETAESYRGDGRYVLCKDGAAQGDAMSAQNAFGTGQPETEIFSEKGGVETVKINRHMDTRRMVGSKEYGEYCETLYREMRSRIDWDGVQKILVLGTEEFMYPALYAANCLEMQGNDVRFHATTRSPIAVCREEQYPLHARYELWSLYDSSRTTYVYDLQKYDMVVIMTDAKGGMADGIRSLICALKLCGNERIVFVY